MYDYFRWLGKHNCESILTKQNIKKHFLDIHGGCGKILYSLLHTCGHNPAV